jgi:AcrR family transcriptional regulator
MTEQSVNSAPNDPASEPRWRRLPEERPRQILDAAFAVFAERGLAAARLDDIARRAGLSKGTIYLYFANKEELFREVVRSTVISALERSEAVVESEPDPRQALIAWMEGYWQWLRSPVFPGMHRLVTSELHSFPDLAAFYATEVVERKQRITCRMIERAMDAGLLRRMDALVAARMLSALFLTHASWYHQRFNFASIAALPDELLLEQIRDFFFNAMRPDPPAASLHVSP